MSKNLKKVLAALLVMVMALSVVACSKPAAEPAEAPAEEAAPTEEVAATEVIEQTAETKIKDTVVVGNIRDITMVNPYGSNTTENLNMFKMTHSRLLDLDPVTYEIIPDLADSWEVSEDGLVWTFKLHEGVKFHNGEPCDADDVIYSFGLIGESSFTAAKAKWIESIEKIDDYTVKFTLNAPYQDMIYAFAYPNLCIVNEKAITEDPDMGYKIGTGAYKIDEWTLGEKTVLVRNDDYFRELPKTRCFEFRLIAEDSSRVIALENGEIDICIQPPAVQNGYINDNENLTLLTVVGNKLNYLALNVEKDLWKNPQAREIITYCIDRESIIVAAAEGMGTPANSVISPKTPFYNPDQTVNQFDLEKAKELLAASGLDPKDLSFEIICNGSVRETIATLIQSDLGELGIDVAVSNMEASALKAKLNAHEHDAAVYNWAPTPGEGTDGTFNSLFYSGSGSNRTIIAEPEVDKMIDEAAVGLDQEARKQLYYDLQSYLVNYGAFIPLYYETITMGVNKNLQNFVCDVAEQHTYTYAYVVE